MGIPGVENRFPTVYIKKRGSIRKMKKGEAAEMFFAFWAVKIHYEGTVFMERGVRDRGGHYR